MDGLLWPSGHVSTTLGNEALARRSPDGDGANRDGAAFELLPEALRRPSINRVDGRTDAEADPSSV